MYFLFKSTPYFVPLLMFFINSLSPWVTRWQNPPTIVPLPVNQRNLPLQNRSPPSGSNPFGQSFKKGPRTFGNPTSTRTLTNANVKLEGPPRKRPKTDPTFTTLPAKQPVRSSRSGNEATDRKHPRVLHICWFLMNVLQL